jgi:hypothetical protein
MAGYVPLQHLILTTAAGGGGNHLVENLSRGVGWLGLGLAGVGLVAAARIRSRLLLPVATFGVLYAVVLLTTPLALARYILPMTGPLAVLVALAASRMPAPLGIVIATVAIVSGLPDCVRYVRFLAVEDTRVEAARLVQQEWARGGRVVLAMNPFLGCYVAPDVAQLPRYDPGLPAADVTVLAERAPHCTRPLETLALSRAIGERDALRDYAGALIVTADPPAPGFERASTPPEVVALLEREATIVADLRVERTPAERAYEVLDLNLVPFSGLASLLRPGPRVRLWRVPPR